MYRDCISGSLKGQKSGTSSDNEWQRMLQWMAMAASDNEWYSEWQIMTTSDNESYSDWQRVTRNGSKWQRVIQWVITNDNEWKRMRIIEIVILVSEWNKICKCIFEVPITEKSKKSQSLRNLKKTLSLGTLKRTLSPIILRSFRTLNDYCAEKDSVRLFGYSIW